MLQNEGINSDHFISPQDFLKFALREENGERLFPSRESMVISILCAAIISDPKARLSLDLINLNPKTSGQDKIEQALKAVQSVFPEWGDVFGVLGFETFRADRSIEHARKKGKMTPIFSPEDIKKFIDDSALSFNMKDPKNPVTLRRMEALAWLICSSAVAQGSTWLGYDITANHIVPVALSNSAFDPEQRIMAILHDVAEDSAVWRVSHFCEVGFSERVVRGIAGLTKIPNEPYLNFIERCSENPDSIIVKLEDIKSNSDTSRQGDKPKTEKQAYVYPLAIAYLEAVQAGTIEPRANILKFALDNYDMLQVRFGFEPEKKQDIVALWQSKFDANPAHTVPSLKLP